MKYMAMQGLFWMAYAIIGSFATVYLQDRRFFSSQIGTVLSAGAILSIIFQSVIASIIDRHQKITQKSAIFVMFLLLLIFIGSLGVAKGNHLLIGFAYIFIFTLLYSLVSFLNSFAMEYINLGIDLNYGLARGIGSISFALVAPVIGIAIARYGSSAIIPAALVVTLLLAIVTLSFKTPYSYHDAEHKESKPAVSREAKQGRQDTFTFLVTYRKFFILLIGFSTFFISHSIINTYQINILENVGGDSSNLGVSLAIAAAVELPTLAAFQYLSRKAKCSTYIKVSAGFFLIKALVIYLAPNVGLIYFSQLFQMGAFALFTPASIFYVNKIIDRSNQVKGQAILGAATTGVGNILGNFIGGNILDAFNINVLLITGVLITLFGFIITMIFTNKEV